MEFLDYWRSIYGEAVQFSDIVSGLPDGCECGDGATHFEGRCPCCDSSHAAGPHEGAETCTALLERLRADLSMLCEDFHRLAAPLEKGAQEELRLELRRGVFLAGSDLGRILMALEHVSESVIGFRRTCSVSQMHRVKQATAAFRAHCARINAELSRA